MGRTGRLRRDHRDRAAGRGPALLGEGAKLHDLDGGDLGYNQQTWPTRRVASWRSLPLTGLGAPRWLFLLLFIFSNGNGPRATRRDGVVRAQVMIWQRFQVYTYILMLCIGCGKCRRSSRKKQRESNGRTAESSCAFPSCLTQRPLLRGGHLHGSTRHLQLAHSASTQDEPPLITRTGAR